jgi:hypothetical protein
MFIKNKRAQVSDTITWIVATMIIVVVLSISVFFTISLSGQKKIFLEDREKDLLATKSITGFLRTLENPALLSDGKGGTDGRADKLKEILPTTVPVISAQASRYSEVGTLARQGVSKWYYEQGEKDGYFDLGSIHTRGGVQFNFWADCYDGGCG